MKLPEFFAAKISPLFSVWEDMDRRLVKIFAIIAALVWFFFVGFFYIWAKWQDKRILDQVAISEKTDSSHQSDYPEEKEVIQPEISSPQAAGFRAELFPPSPSTPAIDENITAHKKLMDVYLQQGKLSESFFHSEKVFNHFKNDSDYLRKLTQLYYDLGKYGNAVLTAEKSLQLTPNKPKLQALLILSTYRSGKLHEARNIGKSMLKKAAPSLEVLTAMGTIDIEVERNKPGNTNYLEKALAISKNYVPALYQIGRCYKMDGNFSDALAVFKRCVKLDPIHAKARGHLGAVYYYLNKDRLAQKEYETALFLNPKDFNTWYNLGELFLSRFYKSKNKNTQREQQLKAFEAYQKALVHYPKHQYANFRVGVLLNGNNQHREALRYFQKITENSSLYLRTLLQKSAAYEHLGMNKEAMAMLKAAFKLDPSNKSILHKLDFASNS